MGAREQVTSFEISHFVRILSRPTKSDYPPLLKHVFGSSGASLHRHGALIQLVPARAPDVPSDLSPPAPCPTAADLRRCMHSGCR